MPGLDPTATVLARFRYATSANRVLIAGERFRRVLKANFHPAEPRVPAGNPDGGQWTDEGGGGVSAGAEQGIDPIVTGGTRDSEEPPERIWRSAGGGDTGRRSATGDQPRSDAGGCTPRAAARSHLEAAAKSLRNHRRRDHCERSRDARGTGSAVRTEQSRHRTGALCSGIATGKRAGSALNRRGNP